MKHNLDFLLRFCSKEHSNSKHQKIRAFHYDHSGHVVTTNSHVLFASKAPWEIQRAGQTFLKDEYEQGRFMNSELNFPDWQQTIPLECGRKVVMEIPGWFDLFGDSDRDATFVLDYSEASKPIFRVSEKINEASIAFNAKYLSCFAGMTVGLFISGPTAPTIITKHDSMLTSNSSHFREDVLKEDWFYVLMPIKLEEEALSEVYL